VSLWEGGPVSIEEWVQVVYISNGRSAPNLCFGLRHDADLRVVIDHVKVNYAAKARLRAESIAAGFVSSHV
jgi:hypothetical protein